MNQEEDISEHVKEMANLRAFTTKASVYNGQEFHSRAVGMALHKGRGVHQAVVPAGTADDLLEEVAPLVRVGLKGHGALGASGGRGSCRRGVAAVGGKKAGGESWGVATGKWERKDGEIPQPSDSNTCQPTCMREGDDCVEPEPCPEALREHPECWELPPCPCGGVKPVHVDHQVRLVAVVGTDGQQEVDKGQGRIREGAEVLERRSWTVSSLRWDNRGCDPCSQIPFHGTLSPPDLLQHLPIIRCGLGRRDDSGGVDAYDPHPVNGALDHLNPLGCPLKRIHQRAS